jgi:small subunit ribosomal protein S20
MAITKSARKAIRQNEKRRERNFEYRDKVKNLVKQVRTLVAQKKVDEAKKILPQVYQILDKAAKVGVIKVNNASRKKSRIAQAIGKLIAK